MLHRCSLRFHRKSDARIQFPSMLHDFFISSFLHRFYGCKGAGGAQNFVPFEVPLIDAGLPRKKARDMHPSWTPRCFSSIDIYNRFVDGTGPFTQQIIRYMLPFETRPITKPVESWGRVGLICVPRFQYWLPDKNLTMLDHDSSDRGRETRVVMPDWS